MSRDYVFIVTLPSDEHTELHVFGDMESAVKVRDAIEGAVMVEQPVLGDRYADEVIEGEADGDDLTTCRHCGALGEDTGGECPRCERNRDTGK